jgi:hypothetical protein
MSGDVLASHDKLTEYVGAAAPVPVKASVVVEVWALLIKPSVALAAPVASGVKVTVNGTLWPAGIVTGSDNPLTLNAELFVLAAVTVTLAPLAVKLPDAVPLVPTTTLPTGSGFGVALSIPAEAAVPVPVTVCVVVEVWALLIKLNVALAAPVV